MPFVEKAWQTSTAISTIVYSSRIISCNLDENITMLAVVNIGAAVSAVELLVVGVVLCGTP